MKRKGKEKKRKERKEKRKRLKEKLKRQSKNLEALDHDGRKASLSLFSWAQAVEKLFISGNSLMKNPGVNCSSFGWN